MQDLSKLSITQLRALEVQVIDELKTRHFLGISQAREQILHIARNTGISVEKLMSTKVPKAPKEDAAAAKYRNPDDPSQQWSGRGRQPAWIKAWLAANKPLEDAKA